MMFKDIPGMYLACSEDFALSNLIPASANCTFPMSENVDWESIPDECQPTSMFGDHLPAIDELLPPSLTTIRLFIMHNLPGRSSNSDDPNDHPISFISSLHRHDIDVNATNDDVNNTLSWYTDSTQLFMAEDSDDPTRIQFRQTYDSSQDIQTSTGCIGHWQFYPDGNRWYDVQALGLAEVLDFAKADTGYGNIKMVRVDEVPGTITEVNDICKERRERFTSSASAITSKGESTNEEEEEQSIDTDETDEGSGNDMYSDVDSMVAEDEEESESDTEEEDDSSASGGRRLFVAVMSMFSTLMGTSV